MAGFPIPSTVAGGPNSPVSAGLTAPIYFDLKVTENLYDESIIPDITEEAVGEITHQGCQLHRRRRPKMTVTEATQDQEYEHPPVQFGDDVLTVDKAWKVDFSVDEIRKIQSDINQMNECAADATPALDKKMTTSFFSTIYTQADSHNYGATAGLTSGAINLGTTGAPVIWSTLTAVSRVLAPRLVLAEQSVSRKENMWFVIPPAASYVAAQSDLKTAFLTGDAKSPIRTGLIGEYQGTRLYESNYLPSFTYSTGGNTYTAYYCPFGIKRSVTFVMQAMRTRTGQMERRNGDYMDMLLVAGWKAFQPEVLGYQVIYVAMPN